MFFYCFVFSLVGLTDICKKKKSGSVPVPVKVNKSFVTLTEVSRCKLRCRRKKDVKSFIILVWNARMFILALSPMNNEKSIFRI